MLIFETSRLVSLVIHGFVFEKQQALIHNFVDLLEQVLEVHGHFEVRDGGCASLQRRS